MPQRATNVRRPNTEHAVQRTAHSVRPPFMLGQVDRVLLTETEADLENILERSPSPTPKYPLLSPGHQAAPKCALPCIPPGVVSRLGRFSCMQVLVQHDRG